MARQHDEATLPKWAQRRLDRLREDYRRAHAAAMSDHPFTRAFYRKDYEFGQSLAANLEASLHVAPPDPNTPPYSMPHFVNEWP